MGDRHDGSAAGPAFLVEPVIPLIPGRHLDADPFRRRILRRVEMLDMTRDATLPAPIRDQCTIPVAIRTPQAEVAVQHLERAARPEEKLRQAH